MGCIYKVDASPLCASVERFGYFRSSFKTGIRDQRFWKTVSLLLLRMRRRRFGLVQRRLRRRISASLSTAMKSSAGCDFSTSYVFFVQCVLCKYCMNICAYVCMCVCMLLPSFSWLTSARLGM